ncbi:MAG: flagellar basal body rod C-terminal domain-containing protein [Myxococcota bacterium]|nr:flagellar basal body rod C-terminal domain-containing protein [Myxococcota bacterium]
MSIDGVGASRSALQAESRRLQASAHNRANMNTEGFKALRVSNVEASTPGAGVETRVERTDTPGPALLDASGRVSGEGSNVDLVSEVVTRLTASRAYEANLRSLQGASDLDRSLLEVTR